MKTEIIKLSQIQVNTANPRQISDVKFQKLIASILALPKMLVLRPIVIDDMYVALGGNMRFRALTAIADMDETELLQRIGNNKDIQKKSDPEKEYLQDYWLSWRDNPTVPTIKASELTDAEQREFIIKDNVGYGDWDMEALANGWDVDELKEWGLDVADWEEDPDPDINEGDIEADEVETRCKEGDVWNLGRHRLMCGDSTSMDDVAKLMDGAVVDLFLTDPPYNVDYEGGTGLKIQNDNMEDTAFLQFLADAFSTADRTLKPGGGVLYMARRLGRLQLQTRLQGDRMEDPSMSDMEQKRACAWQARLPMEARAMPVWLEGRGSALLYRQENRGNHTTRCGRNTGGQTQEGRTQKTPIGISQPENTYNNNQRKQTKQKRRASNNEARPSVCTTDP